MLKLLALVRRIGRFAESIPLIAYVFVVGAATVVGGQYALGNIKDKEFQRGRQYEQNRAQIDSTLLSFAIAAQVLARSRTDTVIRYVTQQAARVDSAAIAAAALARRVPVSLDTVPAVRALKTAVFQMEVTVHALTDSIPMLLQAIDAERASARMTQDVLGAQLTAANMIIAAKSDTIATLERRPTWRTVGKVVVVVPVVWELGKAVVKSVVKK